MTALDVVQEAATAGPLVYHHRRQLGLRTIDVYRGMITQARITEDINSAGLDWNTALPAPAIPGGNRSWVQLFGVLRS